MKDWQWAPRVATVEMRIAGSAKKNEHVLTRSQFKAGVPDIYAAMIAAAPQPPVAEMVAIVESVIGRIRRNADPWPEDTDLARAIVKRLIGDG